MNQSISTGQKPLLGFIVKVGSRQRQPDFASYKSRIQMTTTIDFHSLKKFDADLAWAIEETVMGTLSIFQYQSAQSGSSQSLRQLESSRAYWVKPQQITELAAVAHSVPVEDVKVVRAVQPNGECGYAYLIDIYPLLGCHLIALNEETMPLSLTLPRLFLHELAHTFAFDDSHDWYFLMALTALLAECGMEQTSDPYDYSSERPEKWTIPLEQLPALAASEVQRLRKQYSLKDVLYLLRFRHIGSVKEKSNF